MQVASARHAVLKGTSNACNAGNTHFIHASILTASAAKLAAASSPRRIPLHSTALNSLAMSQCMGPHSPIAHCRMLVLACVRRPLILRSRCLLHHQCNPHQGIGAGRWRRVQSNSAAPAPILTQSLFPNPPNTFTYSNLEPTHQPRHQPPRHLPTSPAHSPHIYRQQPPEPDVRSSSSSSSREKCGIRSCHHAEVQAG